MDKMQRLWIETLSERVKAMVMLSLELYDRELTMTSKLYDYSFIVFPIATAYEGFLKQYFFELGLINKSTYEGKRFRIGRALNPDIHPRGRDEFWLYDDLQRKCGSQAATELWDTWLTCRNGIFHFFPLQDSKLTLSEAKQHIEKILGAIRLAQSCRRFA